MRLATRVLPLAIAAALLFAPALARADGFAAPASALVATTAQGTALAAADTTEDGVEELGLTLRGTDPSGDFTQTEANDVPLWPDEMVLDTEQVFHEDGPVRMVVGGAVAAQVASVQMRFAGGAVLRMSTVAGDGYHGRHAGQVRFFAGEIALSPDAAGDPVTTTAFDAAGAVLSVSGEDSTSRHVRLLRRRVAGTLVRFGAILTSERAPLPLAPEHRGDELCMTVTIGSGLTSSSNDRAACQENPVGLQALRLGGERGCGRLPSTLTGFVPGASREVVAVLGSGRRVHFATRATPFGRAQRVVAAMLGRGEAIRRVLALDGAGHVLARGDVGVAPPDRRCGAPANDWSFESEPPPTHFGVPASTQVAAADPAGPRLLIRERGDQVCLGIDAIALDGSDCEDPPVNSRHSGLFVKHYPGGTTAVAGVFAAQVVSVDLALQGGSRITLPATVSASYTGRYGSALHFAFAVLGPGQSPIVGSLLDALGRPIGKALAELCACHERQSPLRTVLSAGRGARRVRVGADVSLHDACIGFSAGRRPPPECTEFTVGDATVDALVSCARRDTVVYGMTQHAVARVEVELASGRRVDARLARFPASLHASGRAFLAVLGAGASVTGVRFAGVRNSDRVDTVLTPLRPASRQCGYTFRDSL